MSIDQNKVIACMSWVLAKTGSAPQTCLHSTFFTVALVREKKKSPLSTSLAWEHKKIEHFSRNSSHYPDTCVGMASIPFILHTYLVNGMHNWGGRLGEPFVRHIADDPIKFLNGRVK